MSSQTLLVCDYCPPNKKVTNRLAVEHLTIKPANGGQAIERDACKMHAVQILGKSDQGEKLQKSLAVASKSTSVNVKASKSKTNTSGKLCPICRDPNKLAGHRGPHIGVKQKQKRVAAKRKGQKRASRKARKPILRKSAAKKAA